jgi:hypothetical protein
MPAMQTRIAMLSTLTLLGLIGAWSFGSIAVATSGPVHLIASAGAFAHALAAAIAACGLVNLLFPPGY